MQNIGNPKSVKIIDYGFATFIKEQTHMTQKCGTPGYIAPEILEDEYYDELCDIYSLAAIFHILLTGRKLYGENRSSHLLNLNKSNSVKI